MGLIESATFNWRGEKVWKLSPEVLRARYRNVRDQRDAGLAAYQELREAAKSAGLEALWHELEAPPVPTPDRKAERLTRVRVLEGFSTTFNERLIYGYTGGVMDLPEQFVRRVPHLVEKVPKDTPLYCPPIQW